MKLYELNNIEKQYHNNTVLQIDNLTIEQGVMTAIVGNSGSGKTTFLHTLGLITSPTSGELFFGSEDLTAVKKKRVEQYYQKDVDIIFQDYNLIENLSVIENLAILKHINADITEESIAQTLDSLSIGHLTNQLVSKLSGGEMQRVAIARSLLKDTNVILADEPTGALDIENTDAVMEIFTKIISDGKSIVFVTHDLNSAATADQIIVISDGHIVSKLAGNKPDTKAQLEKIFLNLEGGSHA